MRVRWTNPALRQLDEIQDYIAQDDPRAAFDLSERVRRHVTVLLPDHPDAGRPGRIAGTRELVVSGTPYIVAYRHRDEVLEILAIMHGARQWPTTL